MRPVFFDFPQDEETYWEENTFLFCDALLIAPVLWENNRQRDVRLPEGIWYDYWTDTKYTGPVSIKVNAPVDQIPIFIKGGSMVAESPIVQYIGENIPDTLMLHVYPSNTSSTLIYEDDGKSFDYRSGKYNLRNISLTQRNDAYEIRSEKSEGSYKIRPRPMQIIMHDIASKPSGVFLGNTKLNEKSKEWIFDSDSKILNVYFSDVGDYFDLRVVK
jgi:alpha-glucosidase